MGSEDAFRSFENETNSSAARHARRSPAALMNAEEALVQIGPYLPEALNDRERDLFRGIWQGQSYQEIYNASFRHRCQLSHLRSNIAGGLWKKLRPTLGEKVNKSTLRGAVEVAVQRWQTEEAGPQLDSAAAAIAQPAQPTSSSSPSAPSAALPRAVEPSPVGNPDAAPHPAGLLTHGVRDWRDSPDVTSFCGRTAQLQESEQHIRVERCQLLTICGEAGVGKTWFAKQLALQLFDQYERIVWVTLPRTGPTPTLEELLTELLKTLGGDRHATPNSNKHESQNEPQSPPAIPAFIDFLMDHPSLIVLDQFEVLLQPNVDNGAYQPGSAAYGDLLTQLGQRPHLGCVIITSRERPNGAIAAPGSVVRQLLLPGLAQLEAEEFLASRGYSSASPSVLRRLSQKCNGNPRALQAVASWIQEAHFGDVEDFLSMPSSFPPDIMADQAAQFERLSLLEQEIVYQLCQREPPLLTAQILRDMKIESPGSRPNAQRSLLRRSLLSPVPGQPYTHRVSPLTQQYLRHHRLNSG